MTATLTVAPVRLVLPPASAAGLLSLLRAGAWLDVERVVHLEITAIDPDEWEPTRGTGWTVFGVRECGRWASLRRQRPGAPVSQTMSPHQASAWHRVSGLAALEDVLDVCCNDQVVALRRWASTSAPGVGRVSADWTVVVRPRGEMDGRP